MGFFDTVKSLAEGNSARTNRVEKLKTVMSTPSTAVAINPGKWYKGETPTWGEAVGRAYEIGRTNKEQGSKLLSDLNYLRSDPSSMFYNVYSQPTNRAADYLAANGFNTDLLSNGWLNSQEAQSYIRSNLVYDGATNTPKTPGKKSTADQYNAYWLNQYLTAEKDTNAAQSEIDGSFDFIKYWTGSDQNLSDEQIKQKYKDEYYQKNCKTLQKMQSNADANKPLELNRAMEFTDDTIDAMIWMARNPGYNGSIEGAMAYSYLGEGNTYKEDPEISAMLDPKNPDFLPYNVGSTNLDDAAFYFGVRTFTPEWIAEHNGLQFEDSEAGNMYKKVLAAEENTTAAETALSGLNAWKEKNKDKWETPEEAQKALDKILAKGSVSVNGQQYDLSILNKIDVTLGKGDQYGTGDLIAFNRPVNYKYDNMVGELGEIATANASRKTDTETTNEMADDLSIASTEPVAMPEPQKTAATDEIDAVSGAGAAVRKPGDQTGVRTPTDLAPVNYTDSEIEQIKTQDKKIREATDTIENVATANESTVMKNAGSVAFFGNKDRFSWIRNNAVSNQRFADGLTNISAKNLMSEGLGKAHSVAEYSNVEANYAADQQLFNQYRQKYGDLQYLQKEFKPTMTLTLEGADGDTYNVTLTYQDMNKGYQISDVVNTNYVFGESESGNDPGIYEQANAIAREQTAEAKKILYAQKNVHDNYGEAGEKEVEEYKALSARIHNEESYLAVNKEANDQNIVALKKSIEKMEMQYDAMTKEGLDTSGIKRSYDLLNNVLNYHDEPQLPRSTMTKLQYADMVGQLVGEEYDTEKKSELLHRSINNVDEKIRQIQDDIDYAKAQGIEIPERYLRNMELTIRDLEADKKGFEYSTILTDTKQEELDAAIEAGKEFEQYLIDNVLIDDNAIHSAYNFEHLQDVASEDDKKTYYYLLGKQVLAHGDEYKALLHSNNPDDVLTKSGELLETVMQDSSQFLDYMLDDDYGVWTSRKAEAEKEAGKNMVNNGFLGGALVNITSTLLTPVESLSSALYMLDRALGDEQRINPDSKFRSISNFKESTRAETRASIDEYYKNNPTMKYIANLGYEIYCNRGDSVMNALLTGSIFHGEGFLSELAGSSPMGATAALTAAANAIDKGASTEQAWAIAGVTFLAETMTEAVTYSNILGAFGVKEGFTKRSLKDFTIEWLTRSGVEELVGETTNDVIENWADRMVTQWFDNPNYESEHQQLVDSYYAQGYTGEGEAEAKALEEEMKGYLHTAFVSYLSAGTDVMIKTGKSLLNSARTAGQVVDSYRSYTKARQKVGFGESMFDYMRQDARDAMASRDQTTQEASAQEAGVAVPSETAEATPEQKQAAADVTALGRVEGSAQTAQTEMVASVLDDGEGDTAVSDQANAAATFMPTVLGNDSTFVIQQVITGASRMGIDQATVKTALRNAALGNGAATAVVQSEQFQNASPEQKAQMLAETIEQDQNNPDVQQNIAAKVNDFRSGMVINDLAAQGHFDQAQQVQDKADAAAVETAKAETQLQEKQDALDEATRDVEQKAQAVAENPTDDNMKQHADAVTRADNADESRKQYEEHLAKQQEAQKKAEAAAKKAMDDAMTSARETASQTVAQQDQQRAETQAKTDEEEQYHQALLDNGIISPEANEDETDPFGSEEEQEAIRRAHFTYSDGELSYYGAENGIGQELTEAGFHKETWRDMDGEEHTRYVANRDEVDFNDVKRINDLLNAEADERTGKAQEDEDNAKIDALVDSSSLTDEEKETLKKQLKDRNAKRRQGKINLNGKLTDAESMLALGAFQRKLGVPILFSDKIGAADGLYNPTEGVIYLNSKKAQDGSMRLGRALLEVAMHEITHSLEQTKHYQQYRQIVLNTLFGEGKNFDQAAYDLEIKQKQDLYRKNGEELTPEQAEKEIIADFAKKRLSEKDIVQRFMDAGMGGKMRNMLHNINQALKNFFGNLSGEDREAAENLRKAERAFQKAMNERAKTQVHPGAEQFSISQFAQATGMTYNEKTQTLYNAKNEPIDGVTEGRKVTPDMIRQTPVGKLIDMGLEADQKQAALDMFSDLMNMIAILKDNNLVWEIAGGTLESTFSALKANSDTQYHDTIDFGTICAKTQAIVNVMSEVMLDRLKANDIARKEGRYDDVSYGLTRDDVLKIYDETYKAGLSVPCPVCYVFSHWMGVPSLLGQMSRFQHDYIVTGKDANGNDIHYGDGDIVLDENGYATFDPVETEKAARAYIEKMHGLYGDKEGVDARKTKINSEINKGEKRHTKLESDIEKLNNQLKNENLNKRSREAAEKKLAAAKAELEQNAINISALDEELREVEAYNWITQSLMTTNENGEYVIDPDFKITPDEVLLDMRRTGEFADRYDKNWAYRTSRGAGMGKSILPYSGASLGDIIMGNQTRVALTDNPLFNDNEENTGTAKAIESARNRAKRQNLIGGQRLQSTSDFRPEWGLDYIMAFLELQAAKSNAQMYTKVAEAVDLFASAGADVNLSIMGSGNGFHEASAEEIAKMTDKQREAATIDGKVYVMDFSDVTGMGYGDALNKSRQYDNVQMILVGMNDTHIRLALAGDEIDFVIPWHSSGNSKDVLSQLVSSVEETLNTSSDYTNTQSDKFVSRKEKYIDEETGKKKTRTVDARTDEQKTMWNARIKILTGIAQKAVNTEDSSKGGLTEAEKKYVIGKDANPYLKDLYERFYLKEGDKCYGVALTSAQAKQIFPYEYWQTDPTKPGGTKDTADENGRRFIEYCQTMGVVPRFSGVWDAKNKTVKNGNFAGAVYDSTGKITGYDPSKMQKGYWKLLIDRKMYGLDGNYREQKQIDVSGIKIGELEGEGREAHLTKYNAETGEGSMLPTETSAKYGIPALERRAAEESERLIRKPFDLTGTQKLYSSDFSEAEMDDMLRMAGVDYQSAMDNGDTVSAQDSLDYIRQYNPDLAIDTEYMYAVSHGDMETAQRLVNEQAEAKKAEVFAATDVPAYRVRRGYEPKKTVTVYKTFTLDEQGRPSALFVSSKNPLPVGVWLDAQDTYHFTSTKNGRMYVPSTKNPNTKGGATGTPINVSDISEADLAELERLGHIKKNENGEWSAKSLTSLAYRPGWHAGDMPFFPQGGMKIEGTNYENVHRYNQVVFECEMAADEDYTSYDIRDDGTVVYHDRQEMPENGSYKFATNPMANAQDIGAWYISGALKINRALTEAECNEILAENGRAPQEWQQYQDSDELKSIKGKEGKYEYEHTVGPLDLDALGYDPTQNDGGKKLLDPVTYDDNGNIIPLSQRFDKSKQDPRYSFGDQSNMTDSELDDLLRRAGVQMTQEDIDAYQEKTSRPLEGKSAKWSQEEGPAQRQFGGENGMLQESDEIAQQAISYAMAHNAYYPDTNADQILRAINWIRKNGSTKNEDGSYTQTTDGFNESLAKVTSKSFDYRSADGQARMIAVMAMAVAKNDIRAQVELADAFNRQGTDLGRALQSRKLFRMMTPSGRIASIQKLMQNYQDELDSKGFKTELSFSDWIYRAASVAENEADFRKVQEAAAAELAEQLPISWQERLRSLRMMSMLANPRTHIRNVVGNALFIPAVGLKNKIGALMELGMEKGNRTKTLRFAVDKDIREFARQDAETNRADLTGDSKYDDRTLVEQSKKTLGAFEFLSDLNSNALEKEDWIFLKGHYRRALGGWMQANGYTVEQMKNNPELLEQGRAYALNEAQKATYRDFNALASWLNNPQVAGHELKGTKFVLNAVLPFKKTPANILRRGIEYSPVGLARGLWNLARGMNNGTMTANQVIDKISSGLSGTAVMMLGYLLAGTGAVTCGLDDDDWLEEVKGNQKYSININKLLNSLGIPKLFDKDVTYTVDWAAPMAMPLFVGASVRNQADNEGWDIQKVLDALASITEPVFNLSMLDGVNSLLKTNSYSNKNAYTQIGAKILANYFGSYVPSAVGALARTIDDTQRKAYVEKDDKKLFDGTFNYAWEQAKNKLPGISQSSIPVRDVWGNAKTSDVAERIVENWVSPGYIERYEENDPVINELSRLYESTQNKGLEPKHADTSFKNDGKQYDLNAQQYDTFDRVHGETQYSMLKELVNNEQYQQMTNDDAKAEIVKKIYSYANDVGKNAVDPDIRYEKKTVDDLVHDGLVSEQKTKMVEAFEKNDMDAYEDLVNVLLDEGVKESEIKKPFGDMYRDQYKEAYIKYEQTGDEKYNDEMDRIVDILDQTGFEFDIGAWEDQADKKYGNTGNVMQPARYIASAGMSDSSFSNRTASMPERPASDNSWDQYISDLDDYWADYDFASNDPVGQYGQGNIDLDNRQTVQNDDGSISTEQSFSFYDEQTGKEILIPLIADGRVMTQDEAIDRYYETGEYLGMFNDWHDADEYATMLHNRQDWYYHQ